MRPIVPRSQGDALGFPTPPLRGWVRGALWKPRRGAGRKPRATPWETSPWVTNNALGHGTLPPRGHPMLTLLLPALLAAAPVQTDLFSRGTEGYHTFRIPSLLVTAKGTVLAFCEGRKKGTGDSGDIDVVLKRSTDGGKTWKALQVIADDGA